ncbi:MAG: UvrD-helicase domain-containing protein, partial [Bacteroidales bacterium]|nr:UvrD-helicase domain-containing protein [Bacteroidales bacterium]
MSKLRVFNASAGSGKTYQLTKEYLRLILNNALNYRNILAVTFTNKSTAEMKSRIIKDLYEISHNRGTKMQDELAAELHRAPEAIAADARHCLQLILHDYSRFSISTIDSFFQRIIRAFSREIGINYSLQIFLDTQIALADAISRLLLSAGRNDKKQLFKWLQQFAEEKIRSEKGWNLRKDIHKLGSELSKETFQKFSDERREKLKDRQTIEQYRQKLQEIIADYEKGLAQIGERGVKLLDMVGLKPEDFSYNGAGTVSVFEKLLNPSELKLSATEMKPESFGTRFEAAINDPQSLRKKTNSSAVAAKLDAAVSDIVLLFTEAWDFFDRNFRNYYTARLIISDLYALGILLDLEQAIRDVVRENDMTLISESGSLLRQIIEGSDTPFIYEKTGTYYRHFMIDEFQDTSKQQFDNFLPLLRESLANGDTSIVVGDVKQAIYRWRNGDWELLKSASDSADMPRNESDLKQHFELELNNLRKNYRSAGNIIRFNNLIFNELPAILQRQYNAETQCCSDALRSIYNEAAQDTGHPSADSAGYIRMKFIEISQKSRDADDEQPEMQEVILDDLIERLKLLKEYGVAQRDIAVLVRKQKEAKIVAARLLANGFEVLSNESLSISAASSVSFLLNLLELLLNPQDFTLIATINSQYYNNIRPLLHSGDMKFPVDDSAVSADAGHASAERYAPDTSMLFEDCRSESNPLYRFLSGTAFRRIACERNLMEAVFMLCAIFRLFEIEHEHAYIQAFIDQTGAFMHDNNADIRSFIDWWKEQGVKKTVLASDDANAVRIVTIHKSKGLEFEHVFIPFCNWALTSDSMHQPILWCETGTLHEPFNMLDIAPLKCKREMLFSHFADRYRTETLNSYIDNLNLLYVAFTRARYSLHIWAPYRLQDGQRAASSKTVGDLLYAASERFELDSENTVEIGELWREKAAVSDTDSRKTTSVQIADIGYSNFKGNLRMKRNYENFFGEGTDAAGRRNINRGLLLHRVLANLHTAADLPKAVR